MTMTGEESVVVIRGLHPGETYVVLATVISGVEMAFSEDIVETTCKLELIFSSSIFIWGVFLEWF